MKETEREREVNLITLTPRSLAARAVILMLTEYTMLIAISNVTNHRHKNAHRYTKWLKVPYL
jgi:DNA-binding CsgD family transcriptional regulator